MIIHAELLYLIARYLRTTPCLQAAQQLENELEAWDMLPPRYAYDGSVHPRSLQEMVCIDAFPTNGNCLLSNAAVAHRGAILVPTFPACLLCNTVPIALACPALANGTCTVY
jgi:hypothetical protein